MKRTSTRALLPRRCVPAIAIAAMTGLIAVSSALCAETPGRTIVPPAKPALTHCEIEFALSGWSVFYKKADGEGTITCDDGQTAKVKISSRGGGLTVGKSKIVKGFGRFTEIERIDDLFGSYANAEAHAGAGKSAAASVVTKGEISLAFQGTGTGVDLGISFGKFTLSRMK